MFSSFSSLRGIESSLPSSAEMWEKAAGKSEGMSSQDALQIQSPAPSNQTQLLVMLQEAIKHHSGVGWKSGKILAEPSVIMVENHTHFYESLTVTRLQLCKCYMDSNSLFVLLSVGGTAGSALAFVLATVMRKDLQMQDRLTISKSVFLMSWGMQLREISGVN